MAGELFRARLATLAAVCLLILGPAAPAAARPVPPDPEWRPVSCATGEITGFGLDAGAPGQAALSISGWIQPCDADAAQGGGFIAIRYYSTGAEYGRAQPYQSSFEPTAFDVQVDLYGGRPSRGLPWALCLAYDLQGRVACLAIDVDHGHPEALPAVTPIPTDDPRVLPIPAWAVNPVCGTCL
jgi:hypothetical protein